MNKGISVKVNIPGTVNQVRKITAPRLNLAAQHVRGKLVRKLSTPARTAGPSLPGGYPHARTGNLRKSVTVRPATPHDLVARIGTPLAYGRYLEVGTTRMKARPFLHKILQEEKSAILSILAGLTPGGGT